MNNIPQAYLVKLASVANAQKTAENMYNMINRLDAQAVPSGMTPVSPSDRSMPSPQLGPVALSKAVQPYAGRGAYNKAQYAADTFQRSNMTPEQLVAKMLKEQQAKAQATSK